MILVKNVIRRKNISANNLKVSTIICRWHFLLEQIAIAISEHMFYNILARTNVCISFYGGLAMARELTFENHDAYLMYKYAIERKPDLKAHGEVSVKYALKLYYMAFPEQRPRNYRYS